MAFKVEVRVPSRLGLLGSLGIKSVLDVVSWAANSGQGPPGQMHLVARCGRSQVSQRNLQIIPDP